MQETIDVLTAKNSQLLAEREIGDWIRGGSGDNEANNDFTALVQKYITEIEELRAKLCESEKLAEQLRKESAKAKRLSQTFSPAGKIGSGWNPAGSGGGVVDLSMEDDSGYSVQVSNSIVLVFLTMKHNFHRLLFILLEPAASVTRWVEYLVFTTIKIAY